MCLISQSCPTLCDPMDCSPPGSSVHGSLQERILEWVTMPFSRGSSQSRDRTQVSCITGRFFTICATREAQEYWSEQPIPSPGDLSNPGIEPGSPALQAGSLPTELSGSPFKPFAHSLIGQLDFVLLLSCTFLFIFQILTPYLICNFQIFFSHFIVYLSTLAMSFGAQKFSV